MRLILLLVLVYSLTDVAYSQAPPIVDGESFRFVRVKYESNASGGDGRRGWGRWRSNAWATDWPAADLNLHQAIERTTSIPLAGEPIVLTLEDKNIFQYPLLYITEPGY